MASIIEKYDRPFEYAGIVMHLIIAFKFLKMWYAPELEDAEALFSMAILMAFEFIMVHSGVFMAVVPKKISLFILILVYALFAFAFYKSTENTSILAIYGLVILNRMRFAFSNVSTVLRNRVILLSVLAAIIYFILIFVCLFTNGIFGELGLTEAYLEASRYKSYTKGGGVFVDTPHIAIAFGFFYYSTLSTVEALLLKKTN
jgi:hypothetical protein